VSQLNTYVSSARKDVANALDRFRAYQFIWQKDREQDLREFLATEPKVNEFEVKIRSFATLTNEINSYPDAIPVSVVALVTERLKLGLNSEIQLWKNCYGLAASSKYKREINEVLVFVEDAVKRLQRDIRDLEDIKTAMDTLKEVRDNEIRIDTTIQPIEECYALLQRHDVPVAREEIERCDTLRYNWQKLLQLTSHMSGYLLSLQPTYKDNLKRNVRAFGSECSSFYERYRKNGPMVAGVPPREASDRLFLFQNNFDSLFRKYTAYTNGEELFGMPVTAYPELIEIK
jgi:dynein heavy chain